MVWVCLKRRGARAFLGHGDSVPRGEGGGVLLTEGLWEPKGSRGPHDGKGQRASSTGLPGGIEEVPRGAARPLRMPHLLRTDGVNAGGGPSPPCSAWCGARPFTCRTWRRKGGGLTRGIRQVFSYVRRRLQVYMFHSLLLLC